MLPCVHNIFSRSSVKILDQLTFTPEGLIPAIAQDENTGEILMMAWMNKESLCMTIESKRATYWSRSRNTLWKKGEESGNVQEVKSIHFDCDADVLLMKVHQTGGAACHTGHRSCFYREIIDEGNNSREQQDLVFHPKEVYKKK
jgi:phosphoribosyl-AMP cyclohydrolase